MRGKRGFTLVELAIVLVIIGIILGSVLRGASIIKNAKLQRTIQDLRGTEAALYTYLKIYQKYPGDDNKASSRWDVDHGNGNGKIDDTERQLLWAHLRCAGIIPGKCGDGSYPSNTFGGNIVVSFNTSLNRNQICISFLPREVAAAIDSQEDDGSPSTGDFFVPGASGDYQDLTDGVTLCKKL